VQRRTSGRNARRFSRSLNSSRNVRQFSRQLKTHTNPSVTPSRWAICRASSSLLSRVGK
jgi:hypothetical protein